MADPIELKVRLCCEGCKSKAEKELKKITGVEDVKADLKQGKVTVFIGAGEKDQSKLEKKLVDRVRKKVGKGAEILMSPSITGYNPNVKPSDMFNKTYNYENNYYNNLPPSVVPHPNTILPTQSMYFNDDNVNSCSIM